MFRVIKIILAVVIFLSFFWIDWKTIDPDLGWHLEVGQWILKNRAAPQADIYSYTMSGFEWVYHEWLPGAALFWLKNNNAWWLAALIFAFVWSTPFLIWLKRLKTWFGLFAIPLMAILMLGLVGIRPQAISFLLFFVVFEILHACYARPAALGNFNAAGQTPALWFLPLIFLIWANLHGGFAAGLGLWLFWIAFGFICRPATLTNSNVAGRRACPPELPLFVLSVTVTFINPYGARLYGEIFRSVLSREAAKYIAEWQPAIFANEWEFVVPFSLAVGTFIFLLIKFLKKYPLHLSATAFLFLAMFLKYIRMMPLFFVTAIPVFNLGWQFARAEISAGLAARPLARRIARGLIIAAALIAGLIIFLWFKNISALIKPRPYPEKAAAYLKELNSRGELKHLFNSYDWGGYLINTAPEIKVFIDGRMPHWIDKNGDSAMKDYVKVFYGKDSGAWRDVFAKWNINTVLIENHADKKRSNSMVARYLNQFSWLKRAANFINKKNKKSFNLKTELAASNWQVAYEDETAVVLLNGESR